MECSARSSGHVGEWTLKQRRTTDLHPEIAPPPPMPRDVQLSEHHRLLQMRDGRGTVEVLVRRPHRKVAKRTVH
jgi:hypothetical protein